MASSFERVAGVDFVCCPDSVAADPNTCRDDPLRGTIVALLERSSPPCRVHVINSATSARRVHRELREAAGTCVFVEHAAAVCLYAHGTVRTLVEAGVPTVALATASFASTGTAGDERPSWVHRASASLSACQWAVRFCRYPDSHPTASFSSGITIVRCKQAVPSSIQNAAALLTSALDDFDALLGAGALRAASRRSLHAAAHPRRAAPSAKHVRAGRNCHVRAHRGVPSTAQQAATVAALRLAVSLRARPNNPSHSNCGRRSCATHRGSWSGRGHRPTRTSTTAACDRIQKPDARQRARVHRLCSYVRGAPHTSKWTLRWTWVRLLESSSMAPVVAYATSGICHSAPFMSAAIFVGHMPTS